MNQRTYGWVVTFMCYFSTLLVFMSPEKDIVTWRVQIMCNWVVCLIGYISVDGNPMMAVHRCLFDFIVCSALATCLTALGLFQ